MVKMSILKQIKALEKKRAYALDKMLSANLMAPGSYGKGKYSVNTSKIF